MALQKTWAVICSRTGKARAMCMYQSQAAKIFADIKSKEPNFKGSVRCVAIPADHRETGSFWKKEF